MKKMARILLVSGAGASGVESGDLAGVASTFCTDDSKVRLLTEDLL